MTRPFGRLAMCAMLPAWLAACGDDAPPARRLAEVAVEVAKAAPYSPVIVLTGEVAARISSELSFKVGGRIVERKVEVGDHVIAGQVLATLDPVEQQAGLSSSRAGVDAAEAKLRQAASTFERQTTLIRQGFTTRREYDQAEEALRSAQGSLDTAKAQLGTSEDEINQTVLRAGHAGIITARTSEAGEVVQSAKTIFTLAHDGPRDAIFYVYESLLVQEQSGPSIQVALVSDPRVSAQARIREISPVVDPQNGTVKVKFQIIDPPPAMTLGASLTGTGSVKSNPAIVLSWSALSSDGGQPAVWTVDPGSKAVSLRRIAVAAYEMGQIVVRGGLADGDLVVSRGQQSLRPGQVVATFELAAR